MGLLEKAQIQKKQKEETPDVEEEIKIEKQEKPKKQIKEKKGLLDKAKLQRDQKEAISDIKKELEIKKEEPNIPLEKVQLREQQETPVTEETKIEKQEEPKKQIKKQRSPLKKAQPQREQEEILDTKEETSIEKQEEGSKGLLEKARQKKISPKTEASEIAPKKENIDILEEQHNFGWKKLGHQRTVFDHSVNEIRYELIEPELNPREQEIRKELAYLFKMLADVSTFDMTYEEKSKFLKETLEQIIEDNNISFDPHSKKPIKHFSLGQEKSKSEQKEKKPLFGKKQDKEKKDEKQLKPHSKKPINLFSLKGKKSKPEMKEKKPLFGKKQEKTKKDETELELKQATLDKHSKDKIFYHLFRDFLGYGRLDILMHDDGIEDISCDGPDTPIFLHHRKHEAIETNIYFDSEEELNSFIVRLCQVSGKQISIYSPIVDGKLPDGSRLQATLARTVTQGSTFTIRKFKENPLTPTDLIDSHSLSTEMAAYFWMAIESGASILFCGGTASGKTTALNALSLFIPGAHKIISIEDTREVNLPHKNWIAGTTRKGFSASEDSKTGKDIDMFDLIRAALRQRPRVIIVGEVRGREAYSLFQAMATGHTSYSTVHASSIHTLIQRLENPPISLPRALLTSLDIIVFQNAVEIGGKMVRRMTSVSEIIKLDTDTNQLIFMAPFTWVSKTDDRFESSKTSKILNRIKQQNDWDDDQMERELENRMTVLEWMRKKNIRSYKDVGKVVAEYSKYPDKILKKSQEELKQ